MCSEIIWVGVKVGVMEGLYQNSLHLLISSVIINMQYQASLARSTLYICYKHNTILHHNIIAISAELVYIIRLIYNT
jgi:hypothetical protein